MIKVLVVGDSYTFGWLLDENKTYVSLLQSKLDDSLGRGVFGLRNAATIGWGLGDYVAFVEDFGEAIDPDIVLVFLNVDDLGRTLRSPVWDFDASDTTLTRRDVAKNRLKGLLNGLPGYEWLLEHSHLTQLLRTAVVSFGDEFAAQATGAPAAGYDTHTTRLGAALGDSLFRRLSEWCTERNVALFVSTTGLHRPLYTSASEPTAAFMAVAESTFQDLGVPFSDPSDLLFRENPDPGIYTIPNDGHPNEEGAALVAQHIFPFIESRFGEYCRQTNRCATPAAGPAR